MWGKISFSGVINKEEVKALAEKYFAEIPQGEKIAKNAINAGIVDKRIAPAVFLDCSFNQVLILRLICNIS